MQIEQARLNFKVASLSAKTGKARVEAAELLIELSRVESPIDGEVVKVYPHAGEWVNRGDPIARVVRMDRLRVEGFLEAEKFTPREIAGQPLRR